jgi:ubiquinone/menaquinone biosynthesis C-methylase UbiE
VDRTAVQAPPEARPVPGADAEGLEASFLEGEADDLPFPDGAFEVVLSACGAMVAPEPKRTADELLRVCRPGGRIGMVDVAEDDTLVLRVDYLEVVARTPSWR